MSLISDEERARRKETYDRKLEAYLTQLKTMLIDASLADIKVSDRHNVVLVFDNGRELKIILEGGDTYDAYIMFGLETDFFQLDDKQGVADDPEEW